MAEKKRIGRPPKVKVDDILAALDPYLAEADPPIVAEFAHRCGITRQRLYSLADEKKKAGDPRLFDAIKRLSESKEIALERGALSGRYSPSVAIFSLKQLGWTDKAVIVPEPDDAGKDDPLTAALKAEAEKAKHHDGTE